MLRRQIALCLLAMLVQATAYCSPARIGPLEVRPSASSSACFTIPAEEERRSGAPDFHAITVADAASPRHPVWSMAMPRERTFAVNFRMCIPYAGRLPVLPATTAAALVPGHVYDVVLTARTPRAGAPRAYRARFCLRARDARLTQLAPGATACAP